MGGGGLRKLEARARNTTDGKSAPDSRLDTQPNFILLRHKTTIKTFKCHFSSRSENKDLVTSAAFEDAAFILFVFYHEH